MSARDPIGAMLGEENRHRVLAWLSAHPGAKQSECAKALGLSPMAVNRHVKRIRSYWGTREIPPPVEGPLATRRHWVIVKDQGRIPDKKGPFRSEEVSAFVREVVACRPPETVIIVASLTWDYDLWLQNGRERLAEVDWLDSLTEKDWAEINGGRD